MIIVQKFDIVDVSTIIDHRWNDYALGLLNKLSPVGSTFQYNLQIYLLTFIFTPVIVLVPSLRANATARGTKSDSFGRNTSQGYDVNVWMGNLDQPTGSLNLHGRLINTCSRLVSMYYYLSNSGLE